jgi:enamine deaminase RidA (YjgF/YER057c/UK114 family)
VLGDLIFLAGEDSKHPSTQSVQGATVTEQTEFLFQNMRTSLAELGSSLEDVIKITVYLKDPRDRLNYISAAAKYLPQAPPGTLIMGVQLAQPEMLVEVDAIAILGGTASG